MDYFEKTANRIKTWEKQLAAGLKAYFNRLIFPIYLFPLKLITYSAFYFVRFIIRLIWAIIGLVIDTIVFPFRSLKNLLKAVFFLMVGTYLFASLFVIVDYLVSSYGGFATFGCVIKHYDLEDQLKNKVVRVVGGYSQGSGFFISDHEVLTNFHVIAGEPAPKIIFPDGSFITPNKIVGVNFADLAVLITGTDYPNLVLKRIEKTAFFDDESLLAAGYPMGTELKGEATIQKGQFEAFRRSNKDYVGYIQTDINLVEGMSGGPLVNRCGEVVGVNTLGLAGLSMFIDIDSASQWRDEMDERDVAKITLDPAKSPEEAVAAFYTYLKARRMQDGFNLLSKEYLQKTNFEEWTSRFKDILDVNVVKSMLAERSKDTVFVKFTTQNWVDEEIEGHYYEGTWQTVKEDGVYKMRRSNIKEVENPDWGWWYE